MDCSYCITFGPSAHTVYKIIPPKYSIPDVKSISYKGNATTITWADDSVTKVKCGYGETFDRYTGFMAAVCKKMFGSTDKAKKLRLKFDEDEIKRIKKAENLKANELAQKNRLKREKKEVKRRARQMLIEKKAEELAREMASEVKYSSCMEK